jgi:FdhE protein
MGTARSPEAVAQQYPEWRPWISLLGETLQAIAQPAWDAFAPALPDGRSEGAPLLGGAVISVDRRVVGRWLSRLLARTADVASEARPLHEAFRAGRLDPLALLEAAVADDVARLETAAAPLSGDQAPLRAIAPLMAMPLLHAAQRRLASRVAPNWLRGYCPVCGAWPILAEDRGLERTRRLRCLRCSADWAGDWLHCPYCDERDHTKLGGLVPGTSGESRRVETCSVCRGYLKTHTRLQATPAAELALEDLASAGLDAAALGHGYARPQGLGYPLGVRIVETEGRRAGLLRWRR